MPKLNQYHTNDKIMFIDWYIGKLIYDDPFILWVTACDGKWEMDLIWFGSDLDMKACSMEMIRVVIRKYLGGNLLDIYKNATHKLQNARV